MLQQTQVATVIPFFNRFIRTFPTISDLAKASEPEVLRMWEGLGYYRRARHLHRAARQVVRENGAVLPNDPATVAGLPGIGRYTMGAILSQAYERRLPILEANSQRVLSRLLGLREDPRRSAVRERLWSAAAFLLPTRRIGEFNQALMELGALVCLPVPECGRCPVARLCTARLQGIQNDLPLRRRAPEQVRIKEVCVIVRRAAKVLLVQRPDQGRWAGLWEFPHIPLERQESFEAAAGRLLRHALGIRAEIGAEIATLRHAVTHHRIALVCFEADHRSGKLQSPFYKRGRWVRPGQLARFPVSAPQRRLAELLAAPARQKRLF
jgi:A/G-specific adenine glycosylase